MLLKSSRGNGVGVTLNEQLITMGYRNENALLQTVTNGFWYFFRMDFTTLLFMCFWISSLFGFFICILDKPGRSTHKINKDSILEDVDQKQGRTFLDQSYWVINLKFSPQPGSKTFHVTIQHRKAFGNMKH